MIRHVLCAISMLALAASAQAADKLVLGTSTTMSSAIVYVAKENGLFRKHDLEVEFVEPGQGSPLIPGVVSGSLDISAPNITNVLAAIDSGLDIKIVAGETLVPNDEEYVLVLGRNGVDLKTPQDFVGKKVATGTIGGFMNVTFRAWLRKHGVDPDSASYVEVRFAQAVDTLKQGSVDAITTLQPFTTQILDAGVGFKAADFLKEFPDGLPSLVFIATTKWAEENADILKRFRMALEEAAAQIAADPEKAKLDYNKVLDLKPEVLAVVDVPDYQIDIDEGNVQAMIDMMKAEGLLKGNLTAADVVME